MMLRNTTIILLSEVFTIRFSRAGGDIKRGEKYFYDVCLVAAENTPDRGMNGIVEKAGTAQVG